MKKTRLVFLILGCISFTAMSARKGTATRVEACEEDISSILAEIKVMHKKIDLEEFLTSKAPNIAKARQRHRGSLLNLLNEGKIFISNIEEHGLYDLKTEGGQEITVIQTATSPKDSPLKYTENFYVLEAKGLPQMEGAIFPCELAKLYESGVIQGGIQLPNRTVIEYRPEGEKSKLVIRANDGKLPSLPFLTDSKDSLTQEVLKTYRTGLVGLVQKLKLKNKDFASGTYRFVRSTLPYGFAEKAVLVEKIGQNPEFYELFEPEFNGNSEGRGWTDLSGKYTYSSGSGSHYVLEDGRTLDLKIDLNTIRSGNNRYELIITPTNSPTNPNE